MSDLAADREAIRDITIVGAGPVGLSVAFWAGMRQASARIVDALPQIGGQLTTLYPEKWIYDVPGHPRVLAGELVAQLRAQALDPFDVPVHLETTALTVGREPDPDDPARELVVLGTADGPLRSRTVIVAGGHGAFEPKPLPGCDLTAWEGRGAHYIVSEKAAFAGRRVVVVGGGDSACDWALNLLDTAAVVSLVHRREGFRAHEATVQQLMDAVAAGGIELHVPCQVRRVEGEDRIERVVVARVGEDAELALEADALLPQLGFKTALGPLADWGLEIEGGAIAVDRHMRTNLPGVWACGDVTTFDGKLKLIATGFAEAAIAVAQAVHFIRPESRIQPQYSTNTGVPTAAPVP